MVDPVTIAVGGGVGAKLVEKAWEKGEQWLADYYEDHGDAVQEQARENAGEFLLALAGKVDELEEKMETEGELKERIESALRDPDFAKLVQDSILTAARTDEEVKHELLAQMVSKRLQHDTEDLVARATVLACDAVRALDRDQLMYLGLAAQTYHMHPLEIPEEEVDAYFLDWLQTGFQPYLEVTPLSPIEIAHLESASCLSFRSFVSRNLRDLLTPPPPETDKEEWPVEEFLEETQEGQHLQEIWGQLQKITLTSTGDVIGVAVTEWLTGEEVVFLW